MSCLLSPHPWEHFDVFISIGWWWVCIIWGWETCCGCFYFSQMSRELNRMLNRSIDEHSAMPSKPRYSEPNEFLNKVVTPLYKAVQAVRKVSSLVCSYSALLLLLMKKWKNIATVFGEQRSLWFIVTDVLFQKILLLFSTWTFCVFSPTMILFSTFVSLCLQEAKVNKDGKAPHSKWRNYDDMNEYFWYYLLICRLSKNVLEVV